jgi:hypothetical protein
MTLSAACDCGAGARGRHTVAAGVAGGPGDEAGGAAVACRPARDTSAPRPRQRSDAPNSRSSAARILARTVAMSFSPSVRSGERMTTRNASERLSAST